MLSAIAVSMVAFHVHAETLEDAAPEDVKPIVLEEINSINDAAKKDEAAE